MSKLNNLLEKKRGNKKGSIFKKLKEAKEKKGNALISSVPRDKDFYDVSFGQQRLWFLDKLIPDSAFYNMPGAIRISGDLDMTHLEESISRIVKRHETLRTVFINIDGQPVQVVAPHMAVTIPRVDLQKGGKNSVYNIEEKMQEVIKEEASKPFDLKAGPLFRVKLVILAPQEYVLIITMHHIISDGWSIGVFIKELTGVYTALKNGMEPELPEMPVQYIDYSKWQRDDLTGERLEKLMDYWKNRLEGHPGIVNLPLDYPRPSEPTYRGDRCYFSLTKEQTKGLKNIAQQEGGTLFMVLSSILNILLHRYAGQDDIMLGTPIANRPRPELEGIIGFFANTLVLRTDLEGNPLFTELLNRVKNGALEAYEHQDVPFERLIDELNVDRDMSYSPLFQVAFALQNTPAEEVKLPGITISMVDININISKFDIWLSMRETPEGTIEAVWEYATDIFKKETMDIMISHFTTLVDGVIENPNRKICDIPMMRAEERTKLLTEWNNLNRSFPSDKCIHTIVEEAAAAFPNNKAVVFQDERITYEELNKKANRLAHYLQKQGVGPETLVGVYINKGTDLISSVLAILKAGGAYVPLDPIYPKNRVNLILEDSQVPVLLTTSELAGDIEIQSGVVVAVDAIGELLENEEDTNPAVEMTSDNLAYVIYTSGSTGKPKGCLVTHKNADRLFSATDEWFNFSEKDVWTLFHSIAFDFSVWEVWGALLYGGTLVVVPYDVSRNPELFFNLLKQEKVTVLNQTPSAFKQLLKVNMTEEDVDAIHLKYIVFGGEALDLQSLKPWYDRFDDKTELVNMYGITETTVHVTYRPLTKEDVESKMGSVIGCPIPDLQIYLFDQYMNLVPPGVAGEIFVGGDGVARGYLRREELTKERFITNPLDPTGETRLYRSGDLARYLPNGDLEYLGRIDHQVKIRGFRIELGEIEASIKNHPLVDDAVVRVIEVRGDKKIVSYLVLADGADNVAELTPLLKEYLKEGLPEYMVPSYFIGIDTIPLTANGKLNVKALPMPDLSKRELQVEYVAPRNELEDQIAAIWKDSLGLEKIGVRDNFFDLGGHSLLATQLFFRIQEILKVKVPLKLLFETPTIEYMAEAMGEIKAGGGNNNGGTVSMDTLKADAFLDDSIGLAEKPEYPTTFDNIFLTGATGFLGAFLLKELLDQTEGDIYCLVRAESNKAAVGRIKKNMEYYSLWDDEYEERVLPVVGDLGKPLFGLSENKFDALCDIIDIIYHNGAMVNFIYPYAALKDANVLGTKEVIKLAVKGKIKPIEYISSLYVFFRGGQDDSTMLFTEDDDVGSFGVPPLEYTQTKLVSELILNIARDRNIPVSIYRPGRIAGDSTRGACQTDDFLWRFIKGCLQLKKFPAINFMVDIYPADYLSKAIVHISKQKASVGKAFNLFNSRPMEFVKVMDMFKNMGYTLEHVSYQEWISDLISESERTNDNALYSLLPLFTEGHSQLELSRTEFDCKKTLELLNGSEYICPGLDEKLMDTYISYFMETGFFEKPEN